MYGILMNIPTNNKFFFKILSIDKYIHEFYGIKIKNHDYFSSFLFISRKRIINHLKNLKSCAYFAKCRILPARANPIA